MTGEGIEKTADRLLGIVSEMGAKAKLHRANKGSHPVVAGLIDF
jgi:hypothetical protein